MTYTHLTNEQRTQIEALDKEGMSQMAIGRRLGRHATTIGRELERLGPGVVYKAEQAHLEAQCQRQMARRPSKWTLKLVAEVEAGLAEGWSPHQIAGRWRRAGRAPKMTVSG